VAQQALPDPEALGVSYLAYLNGMAEAATKMRRHLLDALRRNEVAHCEDFPDALAGSLRGTTDQPRAVLERTRGDLTVAIVQNRLGEKIARAEGRLAKD